MQKVYFLSLLKSKFLVLESFFFRRCNNVLFYFVIATTTKDFKQRSFIEWQLKEKFYQEVTNLPYQTDLRMMFRTRQQSGLLFIAQNQQKSNHIILEVGLSHRNFHAVLQNLLSICFMYIVS